MFQTLTVADHNELWNLWAPIHTSDRPLELLGRLEHESLTNLFLPFLLDHKFVIRKKVANNINLVIKCALNNPTSLGQKVIEIFPFHLFFGFVFGHQSESVSGIGRIFLLILGSRCSIGLE